MKNPFSKQHKSLDSVINRHSVADTDPQAGASPLSLTKTDTAPVDIVDSTVTPLTTASRRGPTVESHGFEYDESADLPPQQGINDSIYDSTNNSDAAINPYRFNETDAGNASLSLNQYDVNNWYALNGRLGRVKFLAYNFIWSLLMLIPILVVVVLSGPALMAAAATQNASFASLSSIPVIIGLVLLIPAYIFTAIILPRRRLHDIDKSGWWLLLNLVPIANLVLLYWLFLKAGDVGANKYGLPSAPNTPAEKVLAGFFPALFVLGVLAGVIMSIMGDTQTPVLPNNPDINDINDININDSGTTDTTDAPSISTSESASDATSTSSTQSTDNLNQQTDGIAVTPNAPVETPMPNANANATPPQPPAQANPATTSNNQSLDPELQAEIDAAVSGGQAPSPTNTQPDNQNTAAGGSGNASGNGSGDASEDAFIKASEQPILVDRAANPK